MRKTAIFLPPLLVLLIHNHVSLLLFTIQHVISIPRYFFREYMFGYVREKSATFGRNRPWNSKSSNLTDTLEMCLNILHLSIRINITVEFNKRYWFLFATIIYSLQAYEIFTYSIFIAIMNNNSRRQKRNWEQVFDVYFFLIFLHIPYFLLIQWNDTSFSLICFQFLFIFYKLSPSTIVVVGKDKMRFE